MTQMWGHTVGDLVAERFELLGRLGAGGMGTVWQARDLLLEREVALKEMRSSGTEDPEESAVLRERVLREARVLARVRHPNVVTVHEVLDQQPYPWLVMELIVGSSLREILAEGTLAPHRAAHIGLDILGALQAAHQAGVLHRDVKPGNVMIRPDGTAVLTDFGIATLEGSHTLTAPGAVTGSPEYMAPERIRAGQVGPASDLWSLGMLLYVCVEGDNPMRRDSLWQTLLAVCEQPIPLTSRAGALKPAIDGLLLREPEQRPQAEALAELLAAAARRESNTRTVTTLVEWPDEGALVESPKTEVTTRPRRRRRRRRLLVVLGIVVCAALALSAAMVLADRSHDAEGDDAAASSLPAPSDGQPGSWIAQLSEIPHTTDPTQRDTEVAAIQQQVPGAILLNSDDWASLPPAQWIVRAPGDFADGYAALAFCATSGTEQCSGRYLSTNSTDRSYLCDSDPSPDPATCRRPGNSASPTAAGV